MKRKKTEDFLNQPRTKIRFLVGAFTLAFLLLISVYYVAVINPLSVKAFSGDGAGEAQDPYQISNCEQLQEMTDAPDKSYILVDDINCSGAWATLPNGYNPPQFFGTLDGRNHKIIGLAINRPTNDSVGLFSTIDPGAVVKNLVLAYDTNDTERTELVGKRVVGALAGWSRGTIENVHSELNVKSADTQQAYIGGLVGRNIGTISKSSSTGNVSVAASGTPGRYVEAGGLVGWSVPEGTTGYGAGISDSYASGNVTTQPEDASNYSYAICGGLVGHIRGAHIIQRSYSMGAVTCDSQSGRRVGGFVGIVDQIEQTAIQDSYSMSNIRIGENNAAGGQGFIGYADAYIDASSNYFDASAAGTSDCGYSSSATITCQAVNTNGFTPDYVYQQDLPMANWDFETVWSIDNYGSIPLIHRTVSVTPDPPINIVATRDTDNNQFGLTWDAPVSNEGRADGITDYVVEYKQAGQSNWQVFDDGTSIDTTASVTGLDLSYGYSFKIRAVNNVGNGIFSEVSTVPPTAPSAAPSNLSGIGRARTVDLTWTSVPTATIYEVQFRKAGNTVWKYADSTNSEINTGGATIYTLETSTNYEFQVIAKNEVGTGPWSDVVAVSTTAPQSYSITNCQQLQDMKNDLSGNYTLANDIDCSDTTNWNEGQGFEPVGELPNAFNGTFDGRGHTVTGLTIKRIIVQDQIEASAAGIGMFGVVAEGAVSNVTLDSPLIQSFATYSENADQNQDGIADSVSVPQSLNDLQNYSTGEAAQSVLGLAGKVAMGPVAGMVLSSGAEYKNIHVTNVVGIGNTIGGVFGAVIHAPVVATDAQENFVQWQSLKKPFIMDDVTSTGFVNGGVGGGLAVILGSAADATLGEKGGFIIRNSWSTADVNAIIGGGLFGASLSAGAIVPIAVMSAQSTPENPLDMGQLFSAVGSAITTQAIVMDNVHATGDVSACDNIAGVHIGGLGGLVGLGFGVSIRNSYSTGEVSTCSSENELYGVENGPSFTGAGGILGGLGSVLIASHIENSYSTSQVSIKRSDQESTAENRFNISGGIMGGLAGVFATGTNEQNRYAVLNSHASGSVTVDGGEGSVLIAGGLFGTYMGSGTINNSYATGNVTHNTLQSAVVNVSVNGGLIGLGAGVDVPYVMQAVTGNASPNRTQGLLVYNSYATGNVVTNKEGGGLSIAASGGLMGVFVGSGEIVSSHAKGTVGIFPASENWYIEPSTNFPINTDTNASISGGLVGVSAGIDTPLIASLIANGGQEDTATAPTNGINIDNSYASGNVRGFMAGGLIGYGDMLMRINKTYSEGNVNGNIIGGLMGGSGIGGTVGSVFVGMFIGSAINQASGNTAACVDNPRDCGINLLAKTLSKLSQATGPVTITNTYTTSNLTTAAPSFRVDQEETGFKIVQTPIPAIAGGLVGFYTTPGGSITNSYASGDITITPRAERAALDANAVRPPAVPSFAGGLFGVHVALPQPDFEKIANYDSTGLPVEQVAAQFNDLLIERSRVENVFSASRLTVQPDTQAGGVSGLFGSPLNGAFGNDVVDKNRIFKVSNVYTDRARIQVEDCSAVDDPYRLIINAMQDLYVPDGQGGNEIPDEANLDEGYKQIFRENVGSAVLKPDCNYVNKEGNDSNYFKNNKVNAPLNVWDFNKVWVVRKDDYPKFVAGASTTNPVNPPATTTTSNAPSTPGNQEESRVLRRLLAPSERVAFNGNSDSFLKRLLQRVPPLLAKSIPYLIILMLLMLAARYGRQALKAYREHSFYHRSILRVAGTKAAINDYLAITSHYLNTPAAIMSSALELLLQTKKASESELKGIQSKVKSYSEMAGRLLSMNQVSAAASVSPRRIVRKKLPNPLRQKEVYVPLLIAALLLALANALFMYADVYNRSAFRVAIEFTYLILSGGLIVLAYHYRMLMEQDKELARQQLQVESEFYWKREEFVQHAAIVAHDNHLMLDVASRKLKKIPESKLFFNGLNMLGGISKGLSNVQKFSDFSDKPPLLDLSASTTKAIRQVFYEASKRNIKLDTHVRRGIATQITPQEYEQIVTSLLDNALKFGKDNGKIWVSLYRKFNRVVLVVSDDGEGISKEKLPSLLKPFTRATDSMEYNHQGIGLSLYTNKVIVNKYGGSLKIDSELGSGTSVTVTLPLQHGGSLQTSILVKPDEVKSTPKPGTASGAETKK